MFSVRQKRQIADRVQAILRETNHPELPQTTEIVFELRVEGAESWSQATIFNNAAVINPGVNPHNEAQDSRRGLELANDELLAKEKRENG